MITRIGAFSKSHNFVIQQMISNSHIHPFIRQDSPPSVYATLADRKLWSLARKRPSASGVKGATIGERDWTASRCISDAARSIDVRRCFLFFFSPPSHPIFFFFSFCPVIESNAFNSFEIQLTRTTTTRRVNVEYVRIFALAIRLTVSRWGLLRGLNRFYVGTPGISLVFLFFLLPLSLSLLKSLF